MSRIARLLPLLLIAACAERAAVRSDPTASPSTAPPPGGSAVVLRVTYEGGLAPVVPEQLPPAWTLYGDGRVLTVGAERAIYPGPALPNLRVQRVGAGTVARIAREARAAGVDGTARDYGEPGVSDAQDTVFRLTDGEGSAEARVYALGLETGPQPGLTDAQRAARERIAAFLRHLTDLDGWLGEGTVTDETAYAPTAVAVYASRYVAHDDGEPIEVQELAWDGPDPAAGVATRSGACTVVTGEPLAAVLPELRRANTLTRWTYDGKAWALRLRPLLPDERDCPGATPQVS